MFGSKEMTIQIRVPDFEGGKAWYEQLFNRKPDFEPPNCWLQVAQGEPAVGSGPIRLEVADIRDARHWVVNQLHTEVSEPDTRDGVPVYWCNFEDPYGNRWGFYELKDKK
ncbi:VOC family protein [Camelliibacillus cellulosilyticus]|uniref:VOC family protein n=1 Tax=Camelliibacillus cellulosilyticus TaxID=2174486 RepID=A0ABV9GMQ4_9BACL